MSDIESSNWSETAASNNAASPNGWTSSSMLPSQVEPTAREMMAALKRDWDHKGPTVTSGGTNTATLTYSVAPAAYVAGQIFAFIVGNTNTGSTTLNVNALGAKTIKANGANLVGGELTAGQIVCVAYDGTNMNLIATSGPLGVAQGGTGDSGTAWTAYTPTFSASVGTFTTASATGFYKKIGKTVFTSIQIVITTNGTAAGYISIDLPVAAASGVNYQFLPGRQVAVSGKTVSGTIATGATVALIVDYAGSYPGASGETIAISGVYQSA